MDDRVVESIVSVGRHHVTGSEGDRLPDITKRGTAAVDTPIENSEVFNIGSNDFIRKCINASKVGGLVLY